MNQPKIENLEKSSKRITFQVEWEGWKKYIDSAVTILAQDIKVDGFRPGKAPREFVEQRLGKDRILGEAAFMALKEVYKKYIQQEKLDALGEPKAEILKAEEDGMLEFSIETDVMPEVELVDWQKEVKKVNLELKDRKTEVGEDEVEKELVQLASSRAKSVAVNREANLDDQVEVDFTVLQDGVPIENGTGKKHPLVLGKGVFIPGFEEAIVGMKTGESKEAELNFPADYHNKSLAGKPAKFKIELLSVQERILPGIDDEFAKSLGKFEKLEDLKKKIREGIAEEKDHKLKEERRGKILEAIAATVSVEIPETLVKAETEKMIKDFEAQIAQWGMNADDYLAKMGKTRSELEESWKEQAEKRIKNALILERLAKDENVDVKSEQVEEEMNKTLQYYRNVKDIEKKLDMDQLYRYTKGVLVNEEVFKMLEKI